MQVLYLLSYDLYNAEDGVFSEENNNREHSIMDAFSRKCKNKSFFLSVEQTSGKILPLENGNFPLNRNNKTVQARTII